MSYPILLLAHHRRVAKSLIYYFVLMFTCLTVHVDAQSSRWRFVDDTNYNEHRVGVSLLRLSLKSIPRLGNGKVFGYDRSLHWEVAIRNLSTSQTIIIRSGSEISVVQFHDPVWDASDYRTIRLPIPLRDPRAGTIYEDPSSITVPLGDFGVQEVLLPILPRHTKVVKGEMPWGDHPALIRPEIPTFRSWHISKLIVGYHAVPARHAVHPSPGRTPLQPGMIVISPAVTVRVNGRLVRKKVDYIHQPQGGGH